MPSHKTTIQIDGSLPRRELRRKVVDQFLKEDPGTGTGDNTSRYTYYVEKLQDGSRIYLTRPAYLKKGFDFRISVEGKVFLTGRDYPKHDDIFEDLEKKKQENPTLYKKLHKAMIRIWNCEEPSEVLKDLNALEFESGFTVELILKTLKWFLIEQDIRDWNYSGRGMFKSRLDKIAYLGSLCVVCGKIINRLPWHCPLCEACVCPLCAYRIENLRCPKCGTALEV